MFEFDEVQQLRDDALIERLTKSIRWDRRLTVRLLIEMGEVQARGLYRDYGFSTMFDFATQKLGMSEAEAWLRTRVARLARDVPVVLEMLSRGEVTLSTLALLAPRLSAGNLELLDAARGKSKREVEVLLATRYPKPDAPDSIRRLASAGAEMLQSGNLSPSERPRARALQCETAALPLFSTFSPPVAALPALPALATSASSVAPSSVNSHAAPHATQTITRPIATPFAISAAATLPTQTITRPPRAASPDPHAPPHPTHGASHASAARAVVPLSTGRYKISFTGSQRVHDLMREAQDLRRHRDVTGNLEPLFERALELLVAEEKKRKFALTVRPRAVDPSKLPKSQPRATSRVLVQPPTEDPAKQPNDAHTYHALHEFTQPSAAAASIQQPHNEHSSRTLHELVRPPSAHSAKRSISEHASLSPNELVQPPSAHSAKHSNIEHPPLSPTERVQTHAAEPTKHSNIEHPPPSPTELVQTHSADAAHPSINKHAPHSPPQLTQPSAAECAKRPKAKHTRYIPHAVRREVWKRHDGQCCFVTAEGQRCQARAWLEFHHVLPFARGGASRPGNVELLCQPHNLLQAERDYGRGFMQQRMKRQGVSTAS